MLNILVSVIATFMKFLKIKKKNRIKYDKKCTFVGYLY